MTVPQGVDPSNYRRSAASRDERDSFTVRPTYDGFDFLGGARLYNTIGHVGDLLVPEAYHVEIGCSRGLQ
ncbi:MAG TPA: hypothetical protein VEG66_01215 [Thermoplasmata archaeon]|nr:hypothetical protein [Thermoplasmata archaeon]